MLKKKFKYTMQSENPEVEEFWNKNKKKIMKMAIEANAALIKDTGKPLTEETMHNDFVNNADAIYREGKYTMDEALSATLRLRTYKSKEEFFRQGVEEKIMSSEDYMKQVGVKILKNGQVRFRNNKGMFTANTFGSIKFAGEVEIASTTWKKYSLYNASGILLYFYETGSPKLNTYQNMLSEINYE